MRVIGTILAAATIFSLFIFNPQKLRANQENQFITIVNPVRISSYAPGPAASLKAEYSVIQRYSLSATWLLTYDAIDHQGISSLIKRMEKTQEVGIFLEVSPRLAEEAGVTYHDTGFWHHATSVFLSGYTQEERKLLIDTVFGKFKERFGYYPTSVGSWWTDGFSLAYLKDKYQIIGNLGVSDQFSTDGYQLWGQPWSIPFYPSKNHPGIPAPSKEEKLDLVTIQWAPRDPLRGYESSLYSTQDYRTAPNLPTEYFEKLVRLYAGKGDNEFGQVTVGLEGDFTPEAYEGEFAEQMGIVSKLQKEGFEVTNMKDFSEWYREKFPDLFLPHVTKTKDLLGENKEVLWYQSVRYRIGYVKKEDSIKIFDLRVYGKGTTDPYLLSPNRENQLYIYIPSVLDEVNDKGKVWNLPVGTEIKLEEKKILLKGKGIKLPRFLKGNPLVEVSKTKEGYEIIPKEAFPFTDFIYRDYSSEAIHFFKQKKAFFYLLTGKGWNYLKKVEYLIPQGELDALSHLGSESRGKVLVVEGECLQCEYHTTLKHPAFSGRKGYVANFSGKPIVYNSIIFQTQDREEAIKEFKRTGAKYLYLVKFESYLEKLPFSPGDFGVEKIFENANAQIWRVKK